MAQILAAPRRWSSGRGIVVEQEFEEECLTPTLCCGGAAAVCTNGC